MKIDCIKKGLIFFYYRNKNIMTSEISLLMHAICFLYGSFIQKAHSFYFEILK